MSAKRGKSPKKEPIVGVRFVNVILHGAFGYVFDPQCIHVYTPACLGHEYCADNKQMSKNLKLVQGVDYALMGVKEDSRNHIKLSEKDTPILSLKEIEVDRSDIDTFNKRFTRIRLPYPGRSNREERPKLMFGAGYAFVGEIYTGNSQGSLNQMTMCPAIEILVYELEKEGCPCELVPVDDNYNPAAEQACRIPSRELSCVEDTMNFHIFCTKSPKMSAAMHVMGAGTHGKGMSAEGHTRRTFAATVDMIGSMELEMSFPDGFHPAVPNSYDLPAGVDPKSDIDPIQTSAGGKALTFQVNPFFGHVNCASGNIVFLP